MNPTGICFFNPISGGAKTVLTSVTDYPDGTLRICITMKQKDDNACGEPIDLTLAEASYLADRLRFLSDMVTAYDGEQSQ